MKNIIHIALLFLMAATFPGCATSAKRIGSETNRAAFDLAEDYRDQRQVRLTTHDRTFPSGRYYPTFEDQKGIYYLHERRVFIDHRQGDRELAGGIFISHDRSKSMIHIINPGLNPMAAPGTPIAFFDLPDSFIDYIVFAE